MSDYRLDEQSPIHGSSKGLSSSFYIQTNSGVYPVSYPMGTGVLSPQVKCGQDMMPTIHSV
jgi:hypothetical protein